MGLFDSEVSVTRQDAAPIPQSEVDYALAAQLIVAWVGESGDEERLLGWWRSDLVSEFGGEALFFDDRFDCEDHAIADAVSRHFPTLAQKLRGVLGQLNQLPDAPQGPDKLTKLSDDLEQCIRSCRQTKPTVKLIKKHLDLLRDGVHLLQMYDAELTAEAIRAVRRASDVLEYQIAQLQKVGVFASNLDAAATRIRAHLAAERPWRDIASLDTDLQEARAAYTAERQRLLQWQEQQVEEARARVKQRSGFETLNGDQTHKVLRPLALAATNTTPEAVAPTLLDLKDPFLLALRRAEDQANETLDELLSKDDQNPLISRLDLRLKNRELSTEADVEALVDEVKTRFLDAIRAGVRIRLI